tara:strand:- start:542 stop:1456 length:915 start_codon:yes stop_codon:yes gene_type:complete
MKKKISILGVFAVDMTFIAEKFPKIGETILANDFFLGPGGKGSNQAVASSRLGSEVNFLTALGRDSYGEIGIDLWKKEKIDAHFEKYDISTAVAFIYLNKTNAENAIIINSGAAKKITSNFVKNKSHIIKNSFLFLTQFEQPVEAAFTALKIAKKNRVITILNPAPAIKFDHEILKLCDYITPNEKEAEAITGIKIKCYESAKSAIIKLQSMGASNVIITMGAKGAVLGQDRNISIVNGFNFAPAIDTSGAGDCFNGALSFSLSKNQNPIQAVEFACKASAISVTKKGTTNSMPNLDEIINASK